MAKGCFGFLAALAAVAAAGPAAAKSPDPSCTRPSIEKVEGPNVWEPGPGGRQVALWPEGLQIAAPETDGHSEWAGNGSSLVAGRTWNWATYVTRPTMTIYQPDGEAAGAGETAAPRAAMMVLPGGGYAAVAMDLEGTEICDWVTANGMVCALLKYRVPQVWRRDEHGAPQPPETVLGLEDAERAMGLLREGAADYGIDPAKIGVIGFSAGGHLAAMLSNAGLSNAGLANAGLSNGKRRDYAPVDAADDQWARPVFAILAYPGRLWAEEGAASDLSLRPWVKIDADAPQTLLIHAMNDPVDNVRHSAAYGLALSEAGVPVDMRFFAEGCHAFGLRPTEAPITRQWPAMAIQWLKDRGIL